MKPLILVIDDDRGMCELLELGLAKRGYEVRSTTDARKVLELLQQASFAAVVTDLNMPGQNGIELTRQLIGNRPDLPVVVITAFGRQSCSSVRFSTTHCERRSSCCARPLRRRSPSIA